MTHADKENNPEYLLRAVVVHHGKHFASGTLNYILLFLRVVQSLDSRPKPFIFKSDGSDIKKDSEIE